MKSLVRGNDGEPLLCCWDDCGQWGDDRIQEVRPGERGQPVKYIFCSSGHADFWRHSIVSNGNHSPGAKTPSGLFIRS